MSTSLRGTRVSLAGAWRPISYLILVCGFTVALLSAEIAPPLALALLSTFLVAYLAIESIVHMRSSVGNSLVSAPIAASFFTFALPFALTNSLYLIPIEARSTVLDIPVEISPAMLKVMLLAFIGAFGMWFAYSSRLGEMFARFLLENLGFHKTLSRSYSVNFVMILSLVMLSLAARITAISIGVYGYSADPLSTIEWSDARQILSIADAGGKVALLVVALASFSPIPQRGTRIALIALLLLEVSFGVLSGFKSQVVMPVLIILIAHYIQRGRFPRFALPVVALFILISYQLIQPFRLLTYEDTAFRGTSVVSIAEGVVRAQGDVAAGMEGDWVDFGLAFLSRHHSTHIASFGVDYADSNADVPDNAPKFLENIFMAPLYAIVPRVLWPTKPGGDLGGWYRSEVLGINDLTSVGMSPFTYLYLGGGYLAVLLGFGGIGIIQRGAMALLAHGSGGVVIYLGLFGTLVNIDSAFDAIPVSIIRDGIALWVVQRLTFRS